jgi:hypothetical protein
MSTYKCRTKKAQTFRSKLGSAFSTAVSDLRARARTLVGCLVGLEAHSIIAMRSVRQPAASDLRACRTMKHAAQCRRTGKEHATFHRLDKRCRPCDGSHTRDTVWLCTGF